ncbi:PepSY-associated TM helix domain-containing protein [Pseudomonas sp. S36]|uniref:PepSY-associated TM helix domain-containing protein n=1 Tax=Pseudomonas sp. S36 TaxID=2767447 RepID=UPI0019146B62|nr:PepSY-associated TM helix domain-containing protein [Pseudomonas sp. S36]MBK4989133.1 PepSY domain-containing protein [Pseudomonas sp. S36]
MKNRTLTQAYSRLHTMCGLLLGWVLFAVFFTGSLAVYDKEIDAWMRPQLQQRPVDPVTAAQRAVEYLSVNAAQADQWNIDLPTQRIPFLRVSTGPRQREGGTYLDTLTGLPEPVRETVGGYFFFRFHFTLYLPRTLGIWVVGLSAMALLVATASGIIIHKKLFKEFFTFRPGKGQRSWLDAHNAAGVLLMPFYLMIAYTGLVIFYLAYMPAAVHALLGVEHASTRQIMRGTALPRVVLQLQRGDAAAPITSLAPMLVTAQNALGPLSGLTLYNPGRTGSRVEVREADGNRMELSRGRGMVFDVASGSVLRPPATSAPGQRVQQVMAGLHFAQFSDYPLRGLYFFCGLVSSMMIATGLVLFTVKRRRRSAADNALEAACHRAAEYMNVVLMLGLPVSCVALLLANRLLPASLMHRSGWEVKVFFLVWLCSGVHALLRPWRTVWREQLAVACVLGVCVPLLSLALEGYMGGVDVGCLLFGALAAWLRWKITEGSGNRPTLPLRHN